MLFQIENRYCYELKINKKKRSSPAADIAVPADHRDKMKESEKIDR